MDVCLCFYSVEHLKCAKGIGSDCKKSKVIERYSRPILLQVSIVINYGKINANPTLVSFYSFYLQHFPMYRESDQICDELDEAPADIKDIKFRERWECLSREASEQVNYTLMISHVSI